MNDATKPRVLLIDLSSLFWTAYHATAEDGATAARANTLAAVKRCQGEGNDLVAICCDEGKSFRKAISPAYKANRDKQAEAAYGELSAVKERLAADGYLLWGIDGFEADDLIATAAAKAVNAGHDVRIASADKDLMAMLSESVDCLRTHTWTVVGVSAFVEKYGVRPGQFSDWLALVGDASDNIKGAPGVGPKRATELLKEYEYLDVVLAAATDPAEKVHDSAIGKSLRENAEAVRMARKLVELRTDAPIAFEAIYEKREAKPLEEVDLSEIDDDFPKVEGAPPALESGGSTSLSTELSDPASTGEIATYAGPQVEYSRALEPRSFKELVIGCKVLYNARIYAKYPSYESMVGAGMRGREMGYGLGAALDVFHVMDIEGRRSLALHAHAIIDRAMRDPDCEYVECIETTDEQAKYEVKRRSRMVPFVLTYTIEQARLAGLIKPRGNWEKRPAEMLRKTCGVQACRVVFPGAAMGLYCLEEIGIDADRRDIMGMP